MTQKWEVENDKLKSLKKELEKKVSEEGDNIKDISKKEREIESFTAKIESNKNAMVSKADQVNRQQYTVNEISDKKSSEYQLAAKNLKNYQGEKKSLEKETEKMGRKIDDNRADIKELEFKNEELKKQQAALREKVDAQEAVVKAIEEELNGIK